MKQYTFLTESKKKLLKRLSKYTPNEIKKIRDRMISLGKNNGGWYSPEEYGHRMIKGQIERTKKLDPKVKFVPIKDIFDASTEALLSGSILRIPNHRSTILSRPFNKKQFKTKKEYKKALRDYYRSVISWNKNPKSSRALTIADTISHEIDELSSAKKYAKKYGVFPTEIQSISDKIRHLNNYAGNHNPEVLKREAKRKHLLNTLYGRDSYISPPRTHTEYRLNKPLSKRDFVGSMDWAYDFQDIW